MVLPLLGQAIAASAASQITATASAFTAAQGLTASLAVVGALGQGASILENKHAVEALEEADEAKSKLRLVEMKKAERERRRQARIKQAQIENVARQTGTSESSGAIGAVSSVGTQTLANTSFLDVTGQLASQASAYNRRAVGYKQKAQTAGTLANIGMQYGDFGAMYRVNPV